MSFSVLVFALVINYGSIYLYNLIDPFYKPPAISIKPIVNKPHRKINSRSFVVMLVSAMLH